MSALLVVAHPDDETYFFGGFLQKLKGLNWVVVSVTQSEESLRGREFIRACEAYRVTPCLWGFPDEAGATLEVSALIERMQIFDATHFSLVVTHNEVGEYGHPHHIVVHRAVRAVIPRAFTFSYNLIADIEARLTESELAFKRRVLSEIYLSQKNSRMLQTLELGREGLRCSP